MRSLRYTPRLLSVVGRWQIARTRTCFIRIAVFTSFLSASRFVGSERPLHIANFAAEVVEVTERHFASHNGLSMNYHTCCNWQRLRRARSWCSSLNNQTVPTVTSTRGCGLRETWDCASQTLLPNDKYGLAEITLRRLSAATKRINRASWQGWARDVKARERDETETLTSRDRDETETLATPAETSRRGDVCSSRDVIETLKYNFIHCNNMPRCSFTFIVFSVLIWWAIVTTA